MKFKDNKAVQSWAFDNLSEAEQAEFYSGFSNKDKYLQAIRAMLKKQLKAYDLDIDYETPE